MHVASFFLDLDGRVSGARGCEIITKGQWTSVEPETKEPRFRGRSTLITSACMYNTWQNAPFAYGTTGCPDKFWNGMNQKVPFTSPLLLYHVHRSYFWPNQVVFVQLKRHKALRFLPQRSKLANHSTAFLCIKKLSAKAPQTDFGSREELDRNSGICYPPNDYYYFAPFVSVAAEKKFDMFYPTNHSIRRTFFVQFFDLIFLQPFQGSIAVVKVDFFALFKLFCPLSAL